MPRGSVTRRSVRGFAVTGAAVAAALFGMLLVIALSILVSGQRRSAAGTAQADLQQQALTLVYRLSQEAGESREVLLPARSDRGFPFLALRNFDQEIVLYVFQKASSRIVRQVVDPATWQPAVEDVVCADVDSAVFFSGGRGRMIRLDVTLSREVSGKRQDLPLTTGFGVRGW